MTRISNTVSSPTAAADHAWIAAELGKGMEAERSLSHEATARGDSPPDPCMGVVYHEIAAADERHATVIERIAIRYGHAPAAPASNGIGDALGQIKDRFANLGASSLDHLGGDLQAKGRSVQWLTAMTQALKKIGDTASARELSAVLKEEKIHQDALQQGLNRMIEQHARGDDHENAANGSPVAATASSR